MTAPTLTIAALGKLDPCPESYEDAMTATSAYLKREPRTEAQAVADTRCSTRVDLAAFKLRACSTVATGGGPYLLETLKGNLREVMDPVTRTVIQAKIDVVERLLDKKDGYA